MAKLRVTFTFPANLVPRPVIWEVSQKYPLVTNIRRAEVRDDYGWVMLEIDGDEDKIQEALGWVRSTGVEVDLVSGDVVEG
jgi:hypothetical protein